MTASAHDGGMSPQRWQQIERLLDELLDADAAERAARLDVACADDPELRRRVEALLHAEARAPAFLDEDAAAFAASALPEVFAAGSPVEAGRHIGPYRIVRLLGYGGMSVVYLAERDDGQFRRHVALKLLRYVGGDPAESRRRFRAERQILASLQHPNIAQVFDGGITPQGQPYLVMEYVDGLPITAYCETSVLSIDDRLALVVDVCAAVQQAQQRLIVHRDLKPSNILVDGEGRVKLLDFGIAKLLDPAAEEGPVTLPLTREGYRLMTPEYAAPEQVRGEAVTTATDVYALGVLLYELLAGRRPYDLEGKTPSEIEHIVCTQEPSKPSTAVVRAGANVSAGHPPQVLRGDLDTIVLKALRKEPSARYGSAAGLGDDLRRYREGLPVAARPATLRYQAKKFVGRHRWGVATAVGMAALLVGFVVALVLQQQATAHERDRARHEAQKAQQMAATLLDLFETADPRGAQGEPLSVADLLDQGVVRAQQLQAQPAIQAEVLYTIGLAYHGMGRYDDARRQMEEALAIRRIHLPSYHADIAVSLNQLGWIDMEQRDFESARTRFAAALEVLRRVAPESREAANSLHGLGLAYNGFEDRARAEALLREALDVLHGQFGDVHMEIANVLNDLALVLHGRDDDAAAEALLHEALAMRREVLGPDHADVARSLALIGWFRHRAGDYAAAERNYLQALRIRRAIFEQDHPLVTETVRALARLYVAWGKPDEAAGYQALLDGGTGGRSP